MIPLFAQTALAEGETWALVLAGAAIPAAAWLTFFYTRDRFQREPKRLILGLFLVGALPVAILAGLVNGLFGQFLPTLAVAVMVAPIGEETLKYLGTRFTALRSKAFDEPVDGMVYGSTVGLGFAFAENIDYLTIGLIGSPDPRAMFCNPGFECFFGVFLMRGLGTVLMHAVAAGIAGHFLSQRVIGRRPPNVVVKGLALAILVHASWNFLGSMFLVAVLVVLLPAVVYYLRLVRRDLSASPHRLVELDDRKHRVERFAVGPGQLQPCPACGHLNRADVNHCTVCGERLPEAPRTRGSPCGTCGLVPAVDAKFCSACGSALAG